MGRLAGIHNKQNVKGKKNIKESSESEAWAKNAGIENAIALEAFNAVFDVINKNLIDEESEDPQTEEEFLAQNNEAILMILQGVYKAFEQFTPAVSDFIDPDMTFTDNIPNFLF